MNQCSRYCPYRCKLQVHFLQIWIELKISTYQIWVCFCLYGTFLPVICSFHPFQIRRRLIFELICEFLRFRNQDSSNARLVIDVLYCINTNSPTVAPPYYVFRVFTTIAEIAIRLVLVITCEPVNVETESRNFSLFHYSCLQFVHRDIAILIDGRSN